MKKIGIVTLIGYHNYGNKLQNFATQEVFKSLGCEAITVVNDLFVSKSDKGIKKKLKQLTLKKLLIYTHIYLRKVRKKIYLSSKEKKVILLQEERIRAFKQFTNDYIREMTCVINGINTLNELEKQFDFFVVGSDQVWNPNYVMDSEIFFLTFAPKKKRVAYSASFGISEISDNYIEDYKQKLLQMEYISVREEAGAELVYKLTGREVEVLLDPTLMIDSKKWISISKKSKDKPSHSYILTYFLGDIKDEVNDFINKLSSDYNIDVINMADISDPLRYTVDPSEFLDYINSANLVLTDSFHGTVFSILFERPFITFDRVSKGASMNSRIDTLLKRFEFEDRKWSYIKKTENIFKISFSHVPPILQKERNKALSFLREALNINEDKVISNK